MTWVGWTATTANACLLVWLTLSCLRMRRACAVAEGHNRQLGEILQAWQDPPKHWDRPPPIAVPKDNMTELSRLYEPPGYRRTLSGPGWVDLP